MQNSKNFKHEVFSLFVLYNKQKITNLFILCSFGKDPDPKQDPHPKLLIFNLMIRICKTIVYVLCRYLSTNFRNCLQGELIESVSFTAWILCFTYCFWRRINDCWLTVLLIESVSFTAWILCFTYCFWRRINNCWLTVLLIGLLFDNSGSWFCAFSNSNISLKISLYAKIYKRARFLAKGPLKRWFINWNFLTN